MAGTDKFRLTGRLQKYVARYNKYLELQTQFIAYTSRLSNTYGGLEETIWDWHRNV